SSTQTETPPQRRRRVPGKRPFRIGNVVSLHARTRASEQLPWVHLRSDTGTFPASPKTQANDAGESSSSSPPPLSYNAYATRKAVSPYHGGPPPHSRRCAPPGRKAQRHRPPWTHP